MSARSWDSYKDTLFLVLEEFEPRRVLEFGPGFSTDILALYRSIEALISVEHDPIYHKKMLTRLYPNWVLILEENLDLYAQQRGNYAPYDLIFIDGCTRARCLREAKKILSDGGIVMLHDADREQYQDAIKEYRFRVKTDLGSTISLCEDESAYTRLKSCLAGQIFEEKAVI